MCLSLTAMRDVHRVEPQRAVVVAGEEASRRRRPAGRARCRSRRRSRACPSSTSSPLSRVPLRDPRSVSPTAPPSRDDLGVEARHVRVVEHDVVVGVAPDRQASPSKIDRLDSDQRQLPRRHPGLLAAEEAQRLVADPDRVARFQRPALAVETLAVQMCAVARAEVLDREARLAARDRARDGARRARRRARRRCHRRARASAGRRARIRLPACSSDAAEVAALPGEREPEDSTPTSLVLSPRRVRCGSR